MIKQVFLELDGVQLPVIIDEEGLRYYPISYLSEKVLLRKNGSIIVKNQKEKFKEYLRQFEIKFDEKNVQLSNCISEDGLKIRLRETQQGRLNEEQRKKQNILHKYLGIELLSEKAHVVYKIPDDEMSNYEPYILDQISHYIENCSETKFQQCSNCEVYFPLTNIFFLKDDRTPMGYTKVCHLCSGKVTHFTHFDEEKNRIIKQAGMDLYKHFTEDNVYKVYEAYARGHLSSLPDCYFNKDSYVLIIKELLNEKVISNDELSFKILINKYKLICVNKMFANINELHMLVFGEECFKRPRIYKNITSPKKGDSFKKAKVIFDTYLDDKKIKIDNIFDFNYSDIIKKARIRLQDSLGFVVYYHDHQYAGYKFKHRGSRYYKEDNNVLLDLKYLIEKDMKVEIHKIPLYLTKMALRRYADPLYNWIVQKERGSIFEWVNQLYPDKFCELDFDINYFREEFDSVEESQVHDILISNIENVFYNISRNNRRVITVNGMQPDWVVIGAEKCWFIEYFGLYDEKRGGYNSLTNAYAEKMNKKLEKYHLLSSSYDKVFLYPDDLKNNFQGVLEKIKVIR